MEMQDHNSTGSRGEIADPAATQALQRTGGSALVPQPEGGDQRTELYARLRAIIDNATESIRTLKEENAALTTQNTEMSGRIGMLEQRIRAVTADLASDELALRRSAEELEHVLQGTPEVGTRREPAEPPAPPAEEEPQGAVPTGDPSAETTPLPIPAQEEKEPEAETAAPMVEQPSTPPAAYGAGTEEEGPASQPAASPEGSYTVTAYPFVRFSDLGQFQAALQKLSGVHDVQVRRFAQGTLEMYLSYSGATDLATTLRSLSEVEDVREEEPSRLRVRLRTSQDA